MELEERRGGERRRVVSVRKLAEIARVEHDADARIETFVAPCDVDGPVRRPVVDHDELEVAARLGEDAFDRRGEI